MLLSPTAQLALLRNETVQRLVMREIERLILNGELRAGERIRENDIAGRLDVSRASVREALRRLEEADLVRFEKNRGVTVREITLEEAADIYEIRASLEELICRRVAMRIKPEQIDELRALIQRMDQEAAGGDFESYHESNVQFHERLTEFSGSREFAGFYRTLINKLILFRRRTLGRVEAVAVSNLEHHAIVRHLAAKDADAAGRAMHKHIAASGRRMRRTLQQFLRSTSEIESDKAPEATGVQPIRRANRSERRDVRDSI
jgi:phosphonate utilization transcriptional regulator